MMMTIMLPGSSTTPSPVSPAVNKSAGGGKKEKATPANTPPPPPKPTQQQSQSLSNASPTRTNRRRQRSYNPFSNHSVVKEDDSNPRERPILAQSCLSPSDSFTGRKDEDDQEDDDLEEMARRLRAELRYTEILELAEEAERAAEAGQEYFAGQPSTFLSSLGSSGLQDGIPSYSDDAAVPSPTRSKRPLLALRAKTYSAQNSNRIQKSQSASALAARLKKKKINVLTLRPAGDVFPSFGSFHNHLRTHLSRNKVDSQTLIYSPRRRRSSATTTVASLGSPGSSRDKKASSMLHNGLETFSHSFSFDRWMHSSSLSSQEGESEYADALADHAMSTRKNHYSKRNIRVVEPLPGLEIPPFFFSGTTADRDEAVSTEPREQPPSNGHTNHKEVSPGALLDDDDDDSDADAGEACEAFDSPTTSDLLATPPPPYPKRSDGPRSREAVSRNSVSRYAVDQTSPTSDDGIIDNPLLETLTPPTKNAPIDLGHSFLTPARLRDIRQLQESDRGMDQSPAEVEFFLLVGPPAQLRRSLTTNPNWEDGHESESILIPENLQKESQGGQSEVVDVGFRPLPPYPSKNTRDSDCRRPDDRAGPGPMDSSNHTPPHSPGSGSFAGDSVGSCSSPRTKRKVRTRKVKVSIYGSSPSQSVASGTNSILQESQLISVKADVDPIQDSPVAADCSCLSLSPASSIVESASLAVPIQGSLRAFSESLSRPRPALRRSSSAGLLLEMNSSSAHRSDTSSFTKGSASRSNRYQSAMRMMFSRLSPSSSTTMAMKISPVENDDFLRNFLYCSKTAEALVDEPSRRKEPAISCDANSWLCAPFFPDSDMGDFFRNPYADDRGRNGLSLGREPLHAARMDPESWFDLANEQFDGVMTQLVGQAKRRNSSYNSLFEAPILKKSSLPKRPSRATNMVDVGDDDREEKKSDMARSAGHVAEQSLSRPLSGTQVQWLDRMRDEKVGLPMQSLNGNSRGPIRRSALDEPETPPIFVNPTF